ncbi:alpha/beta fold hydrolase [Roseateles depolymerans]|uniref:Fluoroacetate dehalogenase n=1 Tax=Roseateles depolymerans TaxID=76731 RepID=A0A0U3LB74_9BURK|nr:alpha/beta hydrolase [Roseateles depolymerans]ALV08590.1 Fluoroacetate dehalogenase [Roseateles depolymerans]REG21184.1 pimeloyl-ACP methyl ester carboxylesterase [Roseateles depolymerans]
MWLLRWRRSLASGWSLTSAGRALLSSLFRPTYRPTFRPLSRPLSWPLALSAAVLAGCGAMPNTGTQRLVGGPVVYTYVGQGKPVVVLQSSIGDGRDPWVPVLSELRDRYTVFAYDRPGYGDSTATPPTPRNPCGIATELHDLLHASGIQPPYLLVGHSMGGLYQYAFSRLYPDEVAGLVLVDAVHPMHTRRMQVEVPLMANMLESMSRRVFRGMMQAEYLQQTDCVDALLPKRRPDVPVRVLTRTVYTQEETISGFEAMVHGLEPNWLPLIGGKGIQPVEGAGHYIQRDHPEAVVKAVDEVAQEIRERAAAAAATSSAPAPVAPAAASAAGTGATVAPASAAPSASAPSATGTASPVRSAASAASAP